MNEKVLEDMFLEQGYAPADASLLARAVASKELLPALRQLQSFPSHIAAHEYADEPNEDNDYTLRCESCYASTFHHGHTASHAPLIHKRDCRQNNLRMRINDAERARQVEACHDDALAEERFRKGVDEYARIGFSRGAWRHVK